MLKPRLNAVDPLLPPRNSDGVIRDTKCRSFSEVRLWIFICIVAILDVISDRARVDLRSTRLVNCEGYRIRYPMVCRFRKLPSGEFPLSKNVIPTEKQVFFKDGQNTLGYPLSCLKSYADHMIDGVLHRQRSFEILEACHIGPTCGGITISSVSISVQISPPKKVKFHKGYGCLKFHPSCESLMFGPRLYGTFPISRVNILHTVAIDTLSKWVKQGAPPDARVVMLKYELLIVSPPRIPPQTIGEVDVSNRGLKRKFLKGTVGENRGLASMVDKLDDALGLRNRGPFTIVQVFPYGTVELSQNSGPNFKVNGHRLKHIGRMSWILSYCVRGICPTITALHNLSFIWTPIS
ncbi:hypothetical protein Tco_0201385 [Tanacetum coccineum]